MALKLTVKAGIFALPRPMTIEQARSYADRNMPADLRRAGFEALVSTTDPEIHGGTWIRINYAKRLS